MEISRPRAQMRRPTIRYNRAPLPLCVLPLLSIRLQNGTPQIGGLWQLNCSYRKSSNLAIFAAARIDSDAVRCRVAKPYAGRAVQCCQHFSMDYATGNLSIFRTSDVR